MPYFPSQNFVWIPEPAAKLLVKITFPVVQIECFQWKNIQIPALIFSLAIIHLKIKAVNSQLPVKKTCKINMIYIDEFF